MAVVIGEFQAVAEPASTQQQNPGSAPAEAASTARESLAPALLARAHRTLHVQNLRVWAH